MQMSMIVHPCLPSSFVGSHKFHHWEAVLQSQTVGKCYGCIQASAHSGESSISASTGSLPQGVSLCIQGSHLSFQLSSKDREPYEIDGYVTYCLARANQQSKCTCCFSNILTTRPWMVWYLHQMACHNCLFLLLMQQ